MGQSDCALEMAEAPEGAKLPGSGRAETGGPPCWSSGAQRRGPKAGRLAGRHPGSRPAARAQVPRLEWMSSVDVSRSKPRPWMGLELVAAAGRVQEEAHPEGAHG